MPAKVGLRCDGSPAIGVGHVVRCLALADELLARGCEVLLLGRVEGVPWVTREVDHRQIEARPAPADAAGLAGLARKEGVDAVVLDGYHLDPDSGRALRAAGIVVLALVDGTFGNDQDADVYLDQNLDAETQSPHAGDDTAQLLGLDYVLFRDQVMDRRRAAAADPADPPRLLVVFGGTDPFGGVRTIVPLVLGTGLPVHIVAVCADDELAGQLAARPVATGQEVRTIAPTPDLASVAVSCDVAITAAGSSVWELCCLGVPIGVVEVTDNQRVGYAASVERGVALGLGRLEDLRQEGAARDLAGSAVRALLGDVEGRSARAVRAQALVDGRGRERVADRLLAIVGAATQATSPDSAGRLP